MIIIGTALVAGLLAFGLTGWMQRVAKVKSIWLRYYLHVVIAAVLGAGAGTMAEGWAESWGSACSRLAAHCWSAWTWRRCGCPT